MSDSAYRPGEDKLSNSMQASWAMLQQLMQSCSGMVFHLPNWRISSKKTEREIYATSNGAIKAKEYRHNIASERSRVVSEIQAAWGQVTSLADPLSVSIDAPTTSAALNRIQTEKVDGYDLFILESMKNHGLVQVITDDGDFSTVPGIQVFTANRNVIIAARDQGKLVAR